MCFIKHYTSLSISTLANLKQGEKAVITDTSSDEIPLKLLEMGCLPGNNVELVPVKQFSDPIYINIEGAYLAIRKDVAKHIQIELCNNE